MMKNLKTWIIGLLLAIQATLFSSETDQFFEQRFLVHPEAPENKIEFYSLFPKGDGPFPVLFLLHGWQPEESSKGGKQLGDFGYLHILAAQGIAAVSISVPGFGASEGRRDFSGPCSQKAVCAVMDHFKTHPNIDPTRMGLYGISRGAALGAMVSSFYPNLKLQILESGFYDLLASPWPMPEYLNGIRENLLKEAGDDREAWINRSAVYHTDTIKATTLLLHGEFDDRHGLASAKDLHEKLLKAGGNSTLKVYPNATHCLNHGKWGEIIRFLRFHFLRVCGIGIGLSDPSPATQITEILPNSPAAYSGKLRVGDTILRVSPNNDKEEVDVLRMSKDDLASLIIGPPGTEVRLHVQHFDLTHEDIILKRGSTYP